LKTAQQAERLFGERLAVIGSGLADQRNCRWGLEISNGRGDDRDNN